MACPQHRFLVACGALHLANDRKECAVSVLRRAEVRQTSMRFGSETFQERSRQSRSANSRLTRQQHHLPPVLAFDQRRSRSSSSSSRPTSSVRPLACSASKRLSTEAGRSADQASTGPAIPLRSVCPRSSSSNRLPAGFDLQPGRSAVR